MLLCMVLYACAQGGKREAYIELYKQIAIEEMNRSGIPASIKLAQGILESASGTSTLAVKANNHFGIKCGSKWKGATHFHKDDDYDRAGNLIKSCFRKYQSAEESYIAHTEFLMSGARYEFLFSYPKTDYKNWARGLKQAGYATNPRYAELLINIIEDADLARFDKMKEEVIVYEPENPQDPGKVASVKRRKSVNNQVKMVVAASGDTYAELAEILSIPLKKLLKYNDAKSSYNIQQGDFVYTQPKRKKYRYKKEFHTMKEEDTMYQLSQKYGIRLECLYKRNRMEKGTQAAVNERIFLRKKAKNTPKLRSNLPTLPQPERPQPPSDPTDAETPTNSSSVDIHIVQAGENLYRIALKYNTTIDALMKLNNLTSNLIKAGQKLRIK